ncbi:glycosyltransferase [Brooklawnia cerclae]|uniref:GT2 family glycosyltransferase n=1 Tax=Brooklawnia cerclae TaxID=349934 RepID=A0ABX0SDL2_9ACTN|nr:GT2 family glycosyltransferase [Brooklawnia cerclae]
MTDRPSDMWAWAHERPDEPPTPVDASGVLAVLVAHNGDQWLPRTLLALARLDVRPGGLIAMDAGSHDGTRELLERARAQRIVDVVLDGEPAEGFGANVDTAVREAEAQGFRPSWLWLLHDDSAPRQSCLSELLREATPPAEGEGPAILVPKLLHPKRRNHPDQMSAVGESIARSGMRVLTVEAGDIDQHQQEPAPVLGASTAGLLIRMDAWHALGGLSPEIPLFRDGVDLGWRANARGLIVRTCPAAALRHIEAGRVGLRDSTIAPDPQRADRLAGMSVVTMHAEKPGRTVSRLWLQSVVSSIGFLLGKSPSLAASRMKAAFQLVGRRRMLVAANARVREQSQGEVPAGLLPDRSWGVRRFFDRTAGAISDRYYDLVDEDDDGGLDELTGDDFAGGPQRTTFWSPPIIGMIVMLLVSVVASRHLIRFGFLQGSQLLAAPPTLHDAWAAWAQADAGMAGSNAPWLAFTALGSTLALGHPDWFASVLVLGGPALAGWAAFYFLRPITGHGWWTPVLACLWGTLLPVVGATSSGSMDAVVVAVCLPIMGSVMRRWIDADTKGAEGWRLPASLALIGTVLGSFMPLMLVITGVVGVWMAVWRRDVRGGLVAVLGPLLVLGAWVPRLLDDPGRLLVGSDPASTSAGLAPSGLDVLTGSAHEPGTPMVVGAVVVAAVWAAGIVGAIRSDAIRPGTRRLLYVAVAAGPLAGVVLSRFVVSVAGVSVRPDPVPWVLLGLFALLVLAAFGLGRPPEVSVDDGPDDGGSGEATRRRNLLGAVLAFALAVGAAWWVIGGTSELERHTETLPTYVVGVEASSRATRTLMIDLTGGTAQFNVTSATSPEWGTGESPVLSTSAEATQEILRSAQQFAQGQPSDDLASRLAQLGIGHVWLRGASTQSVSNLSSSPSLGVAQLDDSTVVFTVTTQPSRIMLAAGDTETPISDMTVSDPRAGALIVASEPADPDWRASTGGRQLESADSGDWRQAWDADGRSGELRVWMRMDVASVLWLAGGILLLIVLAAPTAQKVNAPRRALAGQGRRGGARR